MTSNPTKNSAAADRNRARKRVLVLDDNPEVLSLYSALATSLHCETHATAKGQDALNAVRSIGPFDLILLDLDMPAMNGIRFYNELRKLPNSHDLKIILTSSHAFAADIAVALNLFAHAPKNMPIDSLKSLIIRALP